LNKIRLLKLDVEGAEGIVLKGLGHFLADHAIEFILVECFDERLRLLNTSTADVAGMLISAGYRCWEFGTESPAGWSQVTEVRSRGDCNYLFSSPSVTEALPRISLTAVLHQTLALRGQVQEEIDRLRNENTALKQSMERIQDDLRSEEISLQQGMEKIQKDLRNRETALKHSLEKLQADNDWLMSSIAAREKDSRRLAVEKQELEDRWVAIQNSAGWRTLNGWRRVRDRLAPPGSLQRRCYDWTIKSLRGR